MFLRSNLEDFIFYPLSWCHSLQYAGFMSPNDGVFSFHAYRARLLQEVHTDKDLSHFRRTIFFSSGTF